MQCPGCREENLPGQARCLFCGRSLEAAPPEPAAGDFVPRVRVASPLARRRQPRPVPAGSRHLRGALRGVLAGALPGLAAWRRGERRTASLQLAAVALPLLAGWLLWRSELQTFAWAAAATGWTWGPVAEAGRRLELPDHWRPVVAVALSVAVLFGFSGAALAVVDALWPEVRVLVNLGPLRAGTFRARPYRDRVPQVGDLVAGGGGNLWVAPVAAVAGQAVQVRGREVLVDGEPPGASPLGQPGEGRPWGDSRRFVVPEGHVVLFVPGLEPTPVDALVGEVVYRWDPPAHRGPVVWPPAEESP